MQSRRQGAQARGWMVALAVCVLACGVEAAADTVTSKGTTLRGTVKALTSKNVAFESEYGEGVILIGWDDVEDISTEGQVMVLHGEEEDLVAPLNGKRDGFVVVGTQEVDVTTIHSAAAVGPDGPTWRDRMRSRWRYWDGNFDLGFNYQQSTTDTTGLVGAFQTTRSKGPSRIGGGASYRYSTEKRRGQPKSTIQEEIKGTLRGEHDISERFYLYGQGDLEYDGIERLSLRSVPKAGVGYTIWTEELDAKRSNFLKSEIGAGWVYQKYFGGVENDFFTVAFGARARYHLPYDSVFDWTFDYLPAVDDWADNFLVRTAASLTVPMFDPVSAKFTVTDEYNNQPAADAAYNNLFLTIGLSIAW